MQHTDGTHCILSCQRCEQDVSTDVVLMIAKQNLVACQEAALAAAKKALENARERAPVRPSYGEFVFQSRYDYTDSFIVIKWCLQVAAAYASRRCPLQPAQQMRS